MTDRDDWLSMSEQLPYATLEGLISIEAALDSGSRDIHALFVRRDLRDAHLLALVRRVARLGAEVQRVDEEALAQIAAGKSHGGLVARVGERKMCAPADLLPHDKPAFIVMLDGVEDPFNFGQAIRAFYAAGADGLVVRPRNWMSAAAVVARASAGASERIPTAVADSVQDAAAFFRSRGVQVVVTDQHRAVPLYEADLRQPVFIVVGGEKRGVTRSFADSADIRLKIPYGRRFSAALDTTSASAVIAFEIMRQRIQT